MKKLLLLLFFTCVSLIPVNAQDKYDKKQNEVLVNQTVLDMIELGFGEDIITTKISTSETKFDTSIQALKVLKEKGVSNDIIVAIIQSSKKNEEEKQENKIVRSGIYFKEKGEFKKIFPTVFSGTKTSTLGAALSYGIADAKIKSVMNNAHSKNVVTTNVPIFHFFFDSKEQTSFASAASNWWFTVASSPNEFVLVRLISKKNKRELETGKANIYSGTSIGVNDEKVVAFDIEAISDFEFNVSPKSPLEPGEYCFFYQGTVPQGGYNNQSVFDFSVSESCRTETQYKKGDFVWVLNDNSKPHNYEIASIEIRKDGIYYILKQRNSWNTLEYKESECYPTKEEANSATEIKKEN